MKRRDALAPNKRSKRPWLIPLVILLILLGLVLLEQKTNWLHWQLNSLIYDNNIHHVACEQLPSSDKVKQVMAEHQAKLDQIKAIHMGVEILIDESCPGKGALRIEFPGHEQRERIEAIINSKTFYGIPYSLINN